nr:substrate-binding domain-containing protein [Tessaracoccus coleopterorum]
MLDNHRAGQLAGEHLLDLGRSRPVCITGREPGVPVRIRAEGFAAALADGGVVLRGEAVREVELTIRDGNEAMSALLAAQPDLDSVYCASGPLSMGAYFALQEQGARDVALVANDDEDWMAIAAPSVTTVRQPTDLIGKSAANLLRERIADPTAAPRTILLEPMLIVRDTSTPTTVLRAPSGEEREERMA